MIKMTEIDALRYELQEERKAFDKLHKRHMHLLKQQGKLKTENRELQEELLKYREIANCSNCKYQNYNWFEDGDEFEICEKGNNEQLMYYHICKEWEEFE